MLEFMQQIMNSVRALPQNFRMVKRGVIEQKNKLENLLDQAAGIAPGTPKHPITLNDMAKESAETYRMLKALGPTSNIPTSPIIQNNTYLKNHIDRYMNKPKERK
jgi:hypothetical protein